MAYEQLSFFKTGVEEIKIENQKKRRKALKKDREETEFKQMEMEVDDNWRGHPNAGSIIHKNGKFYYVVNLSDRNNISCGNAFFRKSFDDLFMELIDARGTHFREPIECWCRYEDEPQSEYKTQVIEQFGACEQLEFVLKYLQSLERGYNAWEKPLVSMREQKKLYDTIMETFEYNQLAIFSHELKAIKEARLKQRQEKTQSTDHNTAYHTDTQNSLEDLIDHIEDAITTAGDIEFEIDIRIKRTNSQQF